ncbi:MAG: hypothetical protein WD270_11885 [Acetobacterales bacterium]
MDIQQISYVGLALVFVLGLVWLFGQLARRFGLGGVPVIRGTRGRRLSIVEVVALDARRRAVLLRRDGTEHLVLLGADRETVIESGIAAPAGGTLPAGDTA